MSRTVANVNVTTDTFELWVTKTNQLLYALSTEILTANDTTANTGTTAQPRRARLHGQFVANTLIATNNLRGGDAGDSNSALLTISSNTVVGGNSSIGNASFFNSYANVWFINSNTQVNSEIITITGNTSIKGNTSVVAISVLGNSTITNTTIDGSDLFVVTDNTSVNSISIFTGNTYVKANSTITLITAQGNGTTSNTILGGNLVQITANLDVTGLDHTIAGNVNFDTGTMFIDSVNNRIGIGTTTPDANLSVNGTANISGALNLANTLIVIGNTSLSNTLLVTGNTRLLNSLAVTGNVTFSNTLLVVGATTLSNSLAVTGNVSLSNTLIVTGNVTFANTLRVIGNVTFANTLSVVGNVSLSNTLTVTGNVSLSNTLTVTGNVVLSNNLTVVGNSSFSSINVSGNASFNSLALNDFMMVSYANLNLGTDAANPLTIFTFDKTVFSTAKITAQVKSLSGNTLAAEMVVAHNGTNPFITVYGTVVSPVTANPGDFSIAIAGDNVELKFKQNSINSASKIAATLIKQ